MSNFIREELEKEREWVDTQLSLVCSQKPKNIPSRLWESMVYSLMAGGKRLRPILCIKAAETMGADRKEILPMALAFEMIHTASLIHDDLPAMDNDSLRRGKPTNHIIFGETLAILAGDALLAWGFEYPLFHLNRGNIPAERIIKAFSIFSQAIGPSGICGGQVLDTDLQSYQDNADFVLRIARQKTAILIQSSVTVGAILAGAPALAVDAFEKYGEHLGLAFQIVDDILDVTATAKVLGKTPGKDAQQEKNTFVTVWGIAEARRRALEESERARDALNLIDMPTSFFQDLAIFLSERSC